MTPEEAQILNALPPQWNSVVLMALGVANSLVIIGHFIVNNGGIIGIWRKLLYGVPGKGGNPPAPPSE